MKVYIIEKGQHRQSGEIFRVYKELRTALSDFQTITENRREENYIITPGISEGENNMGLVLCGFWAGIKGGNGHAEGYRLLECTAL